MTKQNEHGTDRKRSAGRGRDRRARPGRTAGPVSYTHLDVYKRQALYRLGHTLGQQSQPGIDFGRGSLDQAQRLDVTTRHGLAGNGEVLHGTLGCLLYTSRCV